MGLTAKVAAIEFTNDTVRVALVKLSGRIPKVLELHSCAIAPVETSDPAEGEKEAELSAEEQRIEAIKEAATIALKPVRRRANAFVLCVSSEYTIVRTLTVPFRGARRVAAVIPSELEPYLAFPIEELIVDHVAVAEAGKETDVFVAGMRRSILEEQMELLAACGVQPDAVSLDVAGLSALWQAMRASKRKGLSAILHTREDHAILTVLYNRKLVFFRNLSFSAQQLRRSPVSAAREVQNSLRVFLGGWRKDEEITSLVVTGADLSEEEEALFERDIRVPVEYYRLMPPVKRNRRKYHTPPSLLARIKEAEILASSAASQETAAEPVVETPVSTEFDTAEPEMPTSGYDAEPPAPIPAAPESEPVISVPENADAHAEMEAWNCWESLVGGVANMSSSAPMFNLLKEDLPQPSRLRGMVAHILAASFIASLMLAAWGWYYNTGTARNLAEIKKLEAETATLQTETEELQKQGLSVPMEMFTDPTLLDLLLEIGAKMPDSKVALTELKIARPDPTDASVPWITIRGEVKDDAAFDAVFAELKKSALFEVGDSPEKRLSEGKSTFKIMAQRKKE